MTVLYALKDKNRDLFVTRKGNFDILNNETELFDSKKQAERCLNFNYEGLGLYTPLLSSLAYSLLENKYKTNRINIDVSHKEFLDTIDSINLCIVKVQVNERKTKS